MPKTLKPKSITRRYLTRLLDITLSAAYRGDIQKGFIVVEWTPNETTAQVYLDYAPSWNGKSSHYEYGDWTEES